MNLNPELPHSVNSNQVNVNLFFKISSCLFFNLLYLTHEM